MEEKEKNEIISLEDKTTDIVNKIKEEDDIDKTKEMINLFNMNIAKKNIVRVNTLNDLLDKVNEQARERFEKRPDEISNRDLLSYMDALQTQIDKSSSNIKSINDIPAIQVNSQVNINVNGSDPESLSKESRERILNFIDNILKNKQENKDVIDAEVVEIKNEDNKQEK